MFEIGSTLREARVRRKLTLQQIEEDTKIRVKYVQAMENEDFDLIPSPTYVKGFLRTYAEYLGLDPRMILDEYRSRFMPNEEIAPFAGSSALGRPRRPRRRSNLAFVAVAALLVLALVWILGRTSGEEGSGAPPPVAVVTSPTPSHSPSSSPIVQPTKSVVPYQGARLVVLTQDSCWLEVRRRNATGEVVYIGTLPGGASKSFRDPQALYVRFGDPVGVRVKVNGGSPQGLDATVAASYLVTREGMTRI
jgi:cytoskeleton protein RodZ